MNKLLVVFGGVYIPENVVGGHGDAHLVSGVAADEGPAAIFFRMFCNGVTPRGAKEDGISFLFLVFRQEDAMDIPAIFLFEGLYQQDVFVWGDQRHIGEADHEPVAVGNAYAGLYRACHPRLIMGIMDEADREIAYGGRYGCRVITGYEDEFFDAGGQDILHGDPDQRFALPGEKQLVGSAHAPGGAGSRKNGGNHMTKIVLTIGKHSGIL
jgi:hypothetical protein